MRKAFFLAAAFIAPTAASADAPTLRAGEHGDHSRVVLTGGDVSVVQSGRAIEIEMKGADASIDLSDINQRQKAFRIERAAAAATAEGARITLSLKCDCRVQTARLDNGKHVVDIFDPTKAGAAVAPSPVGNEAAPTSLVAPANVLAGAAASAPSVSSPVPPALDAPARVSEAGQSESAAPQSVVAGESAPTASNVISARPDKLSVDEARVRMLSLLQQAADNGIVKVREGAADLAPPTPIEPVKIAAAPTPPSAKPAASAITPESAPTPRLTPAPIAPRPRHACLPDAAFTIKGKSLEQSPLEAIASLQQAAAEATVENSLAAQESLALGYLAIAFGEEALVQFEAMNADDSLYADLARVTAEKPPLRDGLLLGADDCRGAHALWQAAASEPEVAAQIIGRAGDAVTKLPTRLRAAIAARVAKALVRAGRIDEGRRYFEIALAASGETTPELKFVEAKLLELEGDLDGSQEILTALARDNNGASKEALLSLAARFAKTGAPVQDGLKEDLGALAKTARGTQEGSNAALSEADAWARSGNVQASVFLLADAARRTPEIAEEARAKARAQIADALASEDAEARLAALSAYIESRAFVEAGGGHHALAAAAAAAAEAVGLPNVALRAVEGAPSGDDAAHAARLAEVARAAFNAEKALEAAAPFADQPAIAATIVRANLDLNRNFAALAATAALPESSERAALAAEAAWRAGDYKSALRAFQKIEPEKLSEDQAIRYALAASMAGESALPQAVSAALANSAALEGAASLFAAPDEGTVVERGKALAESVDDELAFIEEALGDG